ncbi:Aspartic endopeptidase [Sarracenia purpurea var. burkii]
MAAIFKSFSILNLLLVSCFIHVLLLLVVLSAAKAHGHGFTAVLMHRVSPHSPFYNSSATERDRLRRAFQRSFSRATGFQRSSKSKSQDDIQSQLLPTNIDYVMKLSIGTPPLETLVIADTGSNLIWTQCLPCSNCYKQNFPIFDPAKSKTYRGLSCQSQQCRALGISTCTDQNICPYNINYEDKSFSVGGLGADTFTFGSSTLGHAVSFPNILFGCGHNNQGTFNAMASGIIGLGRGSPSLVNQLGYSRFSYCLSPSDSGSSMAGKINFGDNAVVSGRGVVSTPLIKKGIANDPFYYLTLVSIAVGKKSLDYKQSVGIPIPTQSSGTESTTIVEEGNIIIDSGTTYTFLPADLYENLMSQLRQVIKGEPINDPNGFFELCYGDTNINIPTLTFKFAGAELELPPTSTFVRNGDLLCLAMVRARDLAFFGNFSQKNFLIGYDLEKEEVSFMPTDCSKH